MTNNEFNQGLIGETERTMDGSRLCYKVADGLTEYSKELKNGGRPDKASRVAGVAAKLRAKGRPSKSVLARMEAEIEVVRQRIVDGVDEAIWD